jgi:hypothetical protein
MKLRGCWLLSLAVLIFVLPPRHNVATAEKDQPPRLYGPNASLGGRLIMPEDNPWNQDVSREPVDANSERLIASIGANRPLHPDFGTVYEGMPIGIPYVVVRGNQPKVPVTFQYAEESDRGPYPIPPNAPIEGGPRSKGDRHVLVLDRDNWKLYELFNAFPAGRGWRADSGAVFDLRSNELRPEGWTSADAAGLPIFPGLIRYDEVYEAKEIRHAVRVTVPKSRRAYIHPATHYASPHRDPNLPPMGMRVRLKAGFDVSRYPPECQIILKALKKYGMIVADNGAPWFINGHPDPRWSDDNLHTLKKVRGRDFEVVRMGNIITR